MDKTAARKLAAELKGKTLGGWVVGDYIDSGKSAVVLHAKRDAEQAVLKVFDRELVERCGTDLQLVRIQRERELIGKHHPNLIKILDGGLCSTCKLFYVVMEFCPGKNIADSLKEIPLEKVPQLISQVAAAAKFLEELKNAHRDIKPENIRVNDNFTKAVLLDLGVCRPIGVDGGTDHDSNKPFVGTLRYSPPEFLRRREEDTLESWRAVTFYQLGAVLHDLITRKPLFQEADPYANLVDAVINTVPEINPKGIPIELVSLCRNCLVKDPKTRLQLVNWEAFEFHEFGKLDNIAKIKRRIEQTQTRDRSHGSVSKKGPIPHNHLVESLSDWVQMECVTNKNILPPVTLSVISSGAKVICCDFPAWKGLQNHLRIIFSFSILDHAQIVELSYAAVLSKESASQAPLSTLVNRAFYSGTFQQDSIQPELQKVILSLFAKALEIKALSRGRYESLSITDSYE